MKILKRLLDSTNSYMTYTGRVKTREVLLTYSDRMLVDAGFSRELLESGVKAWPWHLPEPALPAMDFNQSGNVFIKSERLASSIDKKTDLELPRVCAPEVEMTGRDSLKSRNERKVA